MRTESGVNGILLNKEAARVAVDGTITLTARVRPPSNATNQAVTWSSSDPTIATVDENGTITGVGDRYCGYYRDQRGEPGHQQILQGHSGGM